MVGHCTANNTINIYSFYSGLNTGDFYLISTITEYCCARHEIAEGL